MGTVLLFIVGVLSLVLFSPMKTAYLFANKSVLVRIATLFTHMVSHANWPHLLGNYTFGAPFKIYVEEKLKNTPKFLLLFFKLGLCAFLLEMVVVMCSRYYLTGFIGSSGAIFGLVGYALYSYDGRKVVKFASRSLLLFYIVTQAILTYKGLAWPTGIANGAHLGGLLGGVCFSHLHLRHHRRQSRRNRAKKTRK